MRWSAMGAKSRAKIPVGKKQLLSILLMDLIKVVKLAAIEDGLRFGISWRSGRRGSRPSPANRAGSMIG
jgi:hypothetical protein